MSFIVNTTLYVTRASLQSAGIEPVKNWLSARGWSVLKAEGKANADSLFWNAEGHLAEDQPVTFEISRLGASQESATKDVTDAINATGNWSFAQRVTVAVSNVATGAGDLAAGLGKSADPNAPESPLLSTLKFGALAVMAVAVVVVVVYAAPIIRGASDAARG